MTDEEINKRITRITEETNDLILAFVERGMKYEQQPRKSQED
jgi:hypothetical protein